MWVCLVWTICITSATNTYAKVTGSKKCHICSFFSRKVIEMKTAVRAHLTAHLCPLVTAVLSLSQTFPSFLNIFHKRLVKIANMNTQLVGTSFSVLNCFFLIFISVLLPRTLCSLCVIVELAFVCSVARHHSSPLKSLDREWVHLFYPTYTYKVFRSAMSDLWRV